MKSIGGEICSVVTVLAIPLALAAVFPLEAIGFRAGDKARREAKMPVSIIALDAQQEGAALRAAKTAWHNDGETRRAHADLLIGEIPEGPKPPVLGIGDRSRLPPLPIVKCAASPFLPSRRADAPVRIPVEEAEDALAFPKKDLLKID